MKNEDPIGDRLKYLEGLYESPKIPVTHGMVARLDGRTFSGFCNRKLNESGERIVKPFDSRLSMVMEKVMCSLVEEFNANAGYTQSDEISLFWTPTEKSSEYFFGGRPTKIASTLAAEASVRFNAAFEEVFGFRVQNRVPTFDGRVYGTETNTDFTDSLIWRVKDCRKNSVSQLSRSVLGHRSCQGLSSKEMIDLMITDHGISWYDIPSRYRHGIFYGYEYKEFSAGENAYWRRVYASYEYGTVMSDISSFMSRKNKPNAKELCNNDDQRLQHHH